MFCNNCGNEVDESMEFCGKCGKRINREQNFSSGVSLSKAEESARFENRSQGGNFGNDVIDENFVKGKFKWGGGAIAWFVIMIIWNSISIIGSIFSAIVLGGMNSAIDFSELDEFMSGSDFELISSIFEVTYIFLILGMIAVIIILIGYSVLLGKKKKSMFYLTIFGYSFCGVLTIIQAFIFSDKMDKIACIFRDFPYSERKNFQAVFDMLGGTLSISAVFSILIYAGLVTATYFIIKKNWDRLA